MDSGPALADRLRKALLGAGFGAAIEAKWEAAHHCCRALLDEALLAEFRGEPVERAIWKSESLLARTEVIEAGERVQLECEAAARREAVRRALRLGLTVLVRRFDLEHPAAAAFAQVLAETVGLPVFGTLFITPSRSPAFQAHYDAANVFALQLSGAKRWGLFEQVSPLPSTDADVSPVSVPPSAVKESAELVAGDLLYVPRGLIHQVSATGCPSWHISFGALAVQPVRLPALSERQPSSLDGHQ